MASPFVHLHVHSHYSLLSGLAKIPQLLDAVMARDMDAVALTEYGSMYGAIEFYEECLKRKIKPIFGLEVHVAPFTRTQKRPRIDTHPTMLVLLARDLTGYRNLIQLSTKSYLEGFYYKPRVDEELLEQYKEGLIALSGSLGGKIPRFLASGEYEKARETALLYRERYGVENFYLELQSHPTIETNQVVNEGLLRLAKEEQLPLVVTNDVHYVDRADAEAQDIVTCIQQQRTLADPKRRSYVDEDFSLRTPDEMTELFADHPEAFTNTRVIADRCEVKLSLGNVRLPYFPLPAGHSTMESYLQELCERGYEDRYGTPYTQATPEHKQRLEYELSVIAQTGFASYFLIVQDFVNWAKDQGIVVGPGRGSAAGSFASYLLKIVDLDPIQYNLLFERFLNPERIAMPDIDLDFADARRDEVIRYVTERYGADHVAHIITFGTMAAKASVRDVGRAMGFPYDICDRISKLIPMFTDLSDALEKVPELKQMHDADPQIQRLIAAAKKVEDNVRHASTHACAMVITKDPLTQDVPLQFGSKEGDIVTQFAMGPIEHLGILKIDFLGLKNLTILEHAIRIIQETRDVSIDLRKLPMDDAPTFALLQRGETTGVFQLESSGMKRYLRQLRPTEFEDIIAMVSLYRPGPMEWIPEYIAGKHGEKKVTYIHPTLEPILQPTYGVAIYQEQVMQIARSLAGFTLGEADVLRKAMGKKIRELLAEQREKFIDGCVKNGISQDVARRVFSFIEPFAGYGFNRSHAACYAMIAYQTAYLKANFPAEFMAALLAADQENTDRVAIEIAECDTMRIPVLPPDVNESQKDFTVVPREDGTRAIRFGLAGIKNLGEDSIDAVLNGRAAGPFASFEDFARRVPAGTINKRGLESLAKSGALDAFAERAQVLASMETVLSYMKQVQKALDSGQKDLFSAFGAPAEAPQLKLLSVTPAMKVERLAWEKELLGLYVSEHPADAYRPFLEAFAIPLREVTIDRASAVVRVGGLIASARRITTKSGAAMAFIRLEDRTAACELVVFPKLFAETADLWEEGQLIIAEAKIDDRDGDPKLIANKVKRLDLRKVDAWQNATPEEERHRQRERTLQTYLPTKEAPMEIALPTSPPPDLLAKIKQELLQHPGPHPVRLVIPARDGMESERIETALTVSGSEEMHERLATLIAAR